MRNDNRTASTPADVNDQLDSGQRPLRWRPAAVAVAAAAVITGLVVFTVLAQGEETGRSIVVGTDAATIQEAVEAANPGDVVYVPDGTWNEAVAIDVDDITIRGQSRTGTVLDGQDQLADGLRVTADRVAIEDLTVQNYTVDGILVAPDFEQTGGDVYGSGDAVVVGSRIRRVNAHNNGLYGIYLFGVRGGDIADSYASGSGDSGFYVGQCSPCDTLVANVTAEANAIGYEGTNSSAVTVIDSTFRDNRVGMTITSQTAESLAPITGGTYRGNTVVDNDNPEAPSAARGAFGYGIVVDGAVDVTVAENVVTGHAAAGIVVTGSDLWSTTDAAVATNRSSGNATDIVWVDSPDGTACFTGNVAAVTDPPGLGGCGPAPSGTVPEVTEPDRVDHVDVAVPSRPGSPTTGPDAPHVPVPDRPAGLQ